VPTETRAPSGGRPRARPGPVPHPSTLDGLTLPLEFGYRPSGTNVEVYHADRLGSVRALTDAAGTVIASYRSDEFGIPFSATGTSSQPFRYTGEPTDASGLTYLRARFYDPTIGRFMSRDPFAGFSSSPLSLNRYSYVENNPSTLVDRAGLQPTSVVLGGKLDIKQFNDAMDECQPTLGKTIDNDKRRQVHAPIFFWWIGTPGTVPSPVRVGVPVRVPIPVIL